MKANDFIIESAVLEVETVKRLRKLQEKKQINEAIFLAPWIVAAAAWALRTVAWGAVAWFTEETVGAFIDNWRRNNFTPNADFVPEGLKIDLEDRSTGTRYSYRYNNGRWERPVLRPGAGGSLTPTNRWAPVPSSVDMSQVIETATRQRRWYDRLLGTRLSGLGINWEDVSPTAAQRSIALTTMAEDDRFRGQGADQIRNEYDRVSQNNPSLIRRARQNVLEKVGRVPVLNIILDIFAVYGLVGYWYQAKELIEVYDEQVRTEAITPDEYREKVDAVKDSMKTLITAAVSTASIGALSGLISVFIGNRLSFIRRLGGVFRGVTVVALAAAIGTVAHQIDLETVIDTLDAIWILEDAPVFGATIDRFLENLLETLGIQDIVARTTEENRSERNSFAPSGIEPTRENIRRLAREIWSN